MHRTRETNLLKTIVFNVDRDPMGFFLQRLELVGIRLVLHFPSQYSMIDDILG